MKKQLVLLLLAISLYSNMQAQLTIYVNPNGHNNGNGTKASPFNKVTTALQRVATAAQKNVTIVLAGGTYYLDSTLVLTPALLQNHHLLITAYGNQKAVLSGGRKITPAWQLYKGAVMQAFIGKGLALNNLYCNGNNLPMARYPNFDSAARVFNGTAADAINPARVKTWHNPAGGYVHALHSGEWGSFHYSITGADTAGQLQLTGGWQMTRPAPMHSAYRFVENIFEELDAPGEWYYNAPTGVLYVYPPAGTNLGSAVIEYSTLDNLIELTGSTEAPLKNITINNVCFTQTNRSFMLTKEPLLRSDWAIYRGGAVVMANTENITINNCHFTGLGGNAVFVSNYNRNNTISGNEINNIGASAICFVGSATAVRSPSFGYENAVPFNVMDMQPGPQSAAYPAHCTAYNNLIYNIGTIEKQSAGVNIDMAASITVSHNTIYNVPRSGINIGDGCWGGHMIEYNSVFNTVLETGDHGAFNSWGRDRFWLPGIADVDAAVDKYPALPFLDCTQPITLRNNLFYCTHGWDIDLDDGSSNYHIYNNLCLNGGLKLREGFGRVVENNILVNNSFHPHVWYRESNDIFRHNIVSTSYAPIGINVWGKEVNNNFFMLKNALEEAHKNHTDSSSRYGNPVFINPAANNYTVANNSPALGVGFKNFAMDSFGVVSPALKAKAARPPVPGLKFAQTLKHGETVNWMGASLKNIDGLGERSAAGLFDENGVLVVAVSAGSLAEKSGLQRGDVILTLNSKPVNNVAEFLAAVQVVGWMGSTDASIIRNQQAKQVRLLLK